MLRTFGNGKILPLCSLHSFHEKVLKIIETERVTDRRSERREGLSLSGSLWHTVLFLALDVWECWCLPHTHSQLHTACGLWNTQNTVSWQVGVGTGDKSVFTLNTRRLAGCLGADLLQLFPVIHFLSPSPSLLCRSFSLSPLPVMCCNRFTTN